MVIEYLPQPYKQFIRENNTQKILKMFTSSTRHILQKYILFLYLRAWQCKSTYTLLQTLSIQRLLYLILLYFESNESVVCTRTVQKVSSIYYSSMKSWDSVILMLFSSTLQRLRKHPNPPIAKPISYWILFLRHCLLKVMLQLKFLPSKACMLW